MPIQSFAAGVGFRLTELMAQNGDITQPFVRQLGSLDKTLNSNNFNTLERKRIRMEVRAMATATQNLLKVSNMLLAQVVTVGCDQFLTQHGKLVRTANAVMVGTLRMDYRFPTHLRPFSHIPAAESPLSLNDADGIRLKLDPALFLSIVKANAWDRAHPGGDFEEIYYRMHRGALLDNPTPFGQGRNAQAQRRRSRFDLREFKPHRTVHRAAGVVCYDRYHRIHNELFLLTRDKLAANLKSHVVHQFQRLLDLYLEDLVEFHVQASKVERKGILSRLQVYFQPAFIKQAHTNFQLSIQHPTFSRDNGTIIPLRLRRYLVRALQSMWELLVWSLAGETRTVHNPPIGHATTANLWTRLSKFQNWHYLAKGNERLCYRLLPVMRFMQLQRYDWHDLDPEDTGGLKGPQLTPMSTAFDRQPLYMDAWVLVESIIPGCLHPRNGVPGVPAHRFHIRTTAVGTLV